MKGFKKNEITFKRANAQNELITASFAKQGCTGKRTLITERSNLLRINASFKRLVVVRRAPDVRVFSDGTFEINSRKAPY